MSVKIPQDVTREDKLVGPLTLKQFLYLLAGATIVFIPYQAYSIGYLFLHEFVILAFLGGGLTIALAFGQVNGRPFGVFLKNLFAFLFVPKKRIWHKEPRELVASIKISGEDIKDTKLELADRQSGKNLETEIEKLATILDTGGTIDPQHTTSGQVQNLNIGGNPKTSNLNVEDILLDVD